MGLGISVAAGMPFADYVHEAVLRAAGCGYVILADGVVAAGYVKCPRGAGLALKAVLPPGIVGQRHGSELALFPLLVDGVGDRRTPRQRDCAMRLYPDPGLGMVVMANTTAAEDLDALFDLLRRQPW